MYHQYREGWLEVICGCMFSGKTEELIRRINVLSYAKKISSYLNQRLIIVIQVQKLYLIQGLEYLVRLLKKRKIF